MSMATTAVLRPQDCLHLSLQRHQRKQSSGSAFYHSRLKRKSIRSASPHPYAVLSPRPESPTSMKLSDTLFMVETRRKDLQNDHFRPKNGSKKAEDANLKHSKAPFNDRKSPKQQDKQITSCLESKHQFSGGVRILQRPETEVAAWAQIARFEWKGQESVSSPDKNMGPYSMETTSFEETEDCRTERSAPCVFEDQNGKSDSFGCIKEDDVSKQVAGILPPLPSRRFLERWAGAGYSNSPPPTSLPLPNFLSMQSRLRSSESQLMQKERTLGSDTRHLAKQGAIVPCGPPQYEDVDIDVSFATRDLQRVLNLECC